MTEEDLDIINKLKILKLEEIAEYAKRQAELISALVKVINSQNDKLNFLEHSQLANKILGGVGITANPENLDKILNDVDKVTDNKKDNEFWSIINKEFKK